MIRWLGVPYDSHAVRRYWALCRIGILCRQERLIREDLEDILSPFPWVGFGLAVSMPDYKDVFHIAPAARLLYPEDDPTEAAYAKLMCNIARAVRRNAPDCEIAYVIDDASFSGMIAD